MVTRKPYSGPHKLVIAVDVGTTYSGVSYCILQPGQVPEIRGVTRFRGQENGQGNAKVPSILYYDRYGRVQAVGSQALAEETVHQAEDEDWIKAEWWKLHLRPKHLPSTHINDDDLHPLPPGKSAVDILTDFVRYIFDCTKTYIEEHHIGFNWGSVEDSIEFVFTHPNGWEGRQQQQYHEAIELAGLVPSTPKGRSRVHMITEGEASLHYCISSLSEPLVNLGDPQGLVIIDAGGGTIDLSMYSITFDPIKCEEIAPAECHLQGSVFVTRRAKDLLRRKLSGSSHGDEEELNVIIRDFDQTTKLRISDAAKDVYVKIGNRLCNEEQYMISRGTLKLLGNEATGLFDESIEATIKAFHQQSASVKPRISMAFLVGGLGSNEYFWTRLRSYFMAQGIRISRPDNDINKSVANGAVSYYIDRAVKARVARATYGVTCLIDVDRSNPEHVRRKSQWIKSASGKHKIDGHFDPILRKGEKVGELNETRHPFRFSRKNRTDFKVEEVDILCYRGSKSNPEWVSDERSSFVTVCTIRADLRRAGETSPPKKGVNGHVFHEVEFQVVAFFGAAEWTAQVAWKVNGIEQRSPASIIYYDD